MPERFVLIQIYVSVENFECCQIFYSKKIFYDAAFDFLMYSLITYTCCSTYKFLEMHFSHFKYFQVMLIINKLYNINSKVIEEQNEAIILLGNRLKVLIAIFVFK